MNLIALAVSVSLIPFVAVWAAHFLSSLKFSKTSIALIQAIAAGFLLSSVFLDLMPRVLKTGVYFSYVIAFVVGFLLMIILERGEVGYCCEQEKSQKSLKSFLFPFAVEFFVTALLIGVAAATSISFLIIIAISFALCNFVCGLSIATRLVTTQVPTNKRYVITSMLTVLFPVVAFLSATLVSYIVTEWLNDLLSFAIAILLYLVVSELWPEAMSGNKKWSIVLMFCAMTFVFLLLYVIQ